MSKNLQYTSHYKTIIIIKSKNMKTIYKLILFTNILNLTFQYGNAQPAMTWVKQFNGVNSMSDKAIAIANDNNCNLYVTGQSDKSGVGSNYMTIKYDNEGNVIWKTEFDGPDHMDDIPTAIKVDGNGNVYVTGKSASANNGFDFLTVKYDPVGVQQWAVRQNSPTNSDDVANDLAIDSQGNVYVCGNRGQGSALVKYDSNGNLIWLWNNVPSGDDHSFCYKVKIANSGAIMVLADYGGTGGFGATNNIRIYNFNSNTGTNSFYEFSGGFFTLYLSTPVDFVLNSTGVAYISVYSYQDTYVFSTNPTQQIFASYKPSGTADSRPTAIKLDNSGNVYLSGYTDIDPNSTVNNDFIILKFNSSGVQQWKQTYSGTGDDKAINMALGSGSSPDIYVTGYVTNTQGYKDIKTLKYNNNGSLQSGWTQTYNGDKNKDDIPIGIITDAYNNVLIAGYSGDLNTEDYTIIKYISNSFTPVITWTSSDTYTATEGTGYQWYYKNVPINGANQRSYNISSTGNGDYFCMVSQYCYTWKSNIAIDVKVGLDQISSNSSFSVYPNPNQGLFTTTYQLKPNCAGSLEIFNSTGTCIYKRVLPIGSSVQNLELYNIPAGIYNCVICSDNIKVVKKLVIQR